MEFFATVFFFFSLFSYLNEANKIFYLKNLELFKEKKITGSLPDKMDRQTSRSKIKKIKKFRKFKKSKMELKSFLVEFFHIYSFLYAKKFSDFSEKNFGKFFFRFFIKNYCLLLYYTGPNC